MIQKDDNYFKLFACCVPVKGAKQSILCDIQRDQYIVLPTILYYILTTLNNKKVCNIKSYFNNEHDKELDEYFQLLLENDYGFFTSNIDGFPAINLKDFHTYSAITNAIIDYDDHSNHDLKDIIFQLSNLYCEALELRFFSEVKADFFSNLLLNIKDSSLRSVEITIPYNKIFDKQSLLELQVLNPRIKKFIVYSAPFNEIVDTQEAIIYYSTELIDSENCCGIVSPLYFTVKTELFVEAHSFNSCLNRKVGINTKGEIKNCPSMSNSYGNVKYNDIATITQTSEFQEVWKVNKDLIQICSDCEFRYICQDCRAYLKDSNNKLSKPLKCSYDPYEAKWN